jgi:hypothetical protein
MSESPVKKLPPLTLRAIYLRGSNVTFEENFDPLKAGQQLNIESKFAPHSYFITGDIGDTGSDHVARAYTFLTEFETSYFLAAGAPVTESSPFSPTTPVVRINAVFAADYLIAPDGGELSEEDARSWGTSAALMHSWPYWREFSHSTMMRANMPVVLVPMMVAQTAPGNAAPSKVESAPAVKKSKRSPKLIKS